MSGQWHSKAQPAQEPDDAPDRSTSLSNLPEQSVESSEPYDGLGTDSLTAMTTQEIRAGQKEDLVISPILHLKSWNQKPNRSERIGIGGHGGLLLKEWRRLGIRNGIMYRKVRDCQRGVVEQLVLPEKLRTLVKTYLHDKAGHLGFQRTLQMIKERFYWPRMFQEIVSWCEQCERCCLRKTPISGIRAPLVSIHSSAPMELVCILLSLEKTKGVVEHVLVVTDHFSRYAQAYPTRHQKA